MNTRSAWGGCLVVAMLLGASSIASGAPRSGSASATTLSSLRTQIQDFSDKLGVAHAKNMALQSEVTELEKQNAARKLQLQQRDDQIAALQRQLAAAGAPVSAVSTGG